MKYGPLFHFFMHEASKAHGRDRPWARIVLHPEDLYALEREIARHRVELGGIAMLGPGGIIILGGMVVNQSAGIYPGWAVLFDADAATVTMREISCHAHEDCREHGRGWRARAGSPTPAQHARRRSETERSCTRQSAGDGLLAPRPAPPEVPNLPA